MDQGLNPIADLSVNPGKFIKNQVSSAVSNAKSSMQGPVPKIPATLPVGKSPASTLPMASTPPPTTSIASVPPVSKAAVSSKPTTAPQISTPGLQNVSKNLPSASQSTLQQNNIKAQAPNPSSASIVTPSIDHLQSLNDLAATVDAKPDMTLQDINKDFPEFSGKDQAVLDYIATVQAKPNMSDDEVKQKFPEFFDPPPPTVANSSAFKVPEPIKDLGNTLWNTIKNEGGVIKDTFLGNISPESAAVQTVSNATDAFMAPISAGITSIAKLIPTDNGPDGVNEFLNNTSAGQAISSTLQTYQDFASKHPEAAADAGAIVNIALNTLGLGAEGKVAKGTVSKTLEKVGQGLESTASSAVQPAVKAIENRAIKASNKPLEKNVAKLLSEPTTSNTVKKALGSKSRGEIVYDPKEGFSKFLLGDKKLELLPSDKSQMAQKIIKDNIVSPSSNPQVLNQQVNSVVKKISNDLSPKLQMLRTKSFPEEISKAQTTFANKIYPDLDLQELRSTEIANIKKSISDLDKATNADEIWTAAKNYDGAFSDRIKSNPGSKSYDVWREGRDVFNNLLEDMVTKADEPSVKKVFSDISALKTAQDNIKLNISDLLKPKEGLINKKGLLRKAAEVAGVGLGSLGAYKVFGN